MVEPLAPAKYLILDRPLLWQVHSVICDLRYSLPVPTLLLRDSPASLPITVRYPLELPEMATDERRFISRTELGLPQDVPVVGNAGWLIPRKRFDVFLKVAARVIEKRPEVKFVIAGDGPERQDLKTLMNQLRIGKNILAKRFDSVLSESGRAIIQFRLG